MISFPKVARRESSSFPLTRRTSSRMSPSRYSSASRLKNQVPEALSITAFRAAAKSSTQGKSNRMSAWRLATSRLPSVEPVSAMISSQGTARRRGSRAARHRSRLRISSLKIMPMVKTGWLMSILLFYPCFWENRPTGGFPKNGAENGAGLRPPRKRWVL